MQPNTLTRGEYKGKIIYIKKYEKKTPLGYEPIEK
jgi:hypothetical protein